MISAAFFDRDGTINVNFGYVYKNKDLVFIEKIPEIIKQYNDNNVPVIVVTNQAGIARGFYTIEDMNNFNSYLNTQLYIKFGAHIDKFYFCPHHPDFTGDCDCRKPKPGMLIRAATELNLSLPNSVMYGDAESDFLASVSAHIGKFVFVQDLNLSK